LFRTSDCTPEYHPPAKARPGFYAGPETIAGEVTLTVSPSFGRETFLCLVAVLSAALTVTTFMSEQARGQGVSYPAARRVTQVDNYHGVDVLDPYRWMEQMQSAETLAWVKAQDDLLRNFLAQAGERELIRQRIGELVAYDKYSAPVKAGGRLFFTKVEAGKGSGQALLYMQEGADLKPRLISDFGSRFDKDSLLGNFSPSPDGQYVAYTVSKRQSRWLEVHVLDVAAGKELPEVLTGVHSIMGRISWTKDGRGFFYSAFEQPQPGTENMAVVRNPKLYFHVLGQAQAADSIISDLPPEPTSLLSHQITDDGRYIVVSAQEGGEPKNRVFYKEVGSPQTSIKPLVDSADASFIFLGNEGALFWFYTDLHAPNGRVVAIKLDRPERRYWTEVIPEAREAINARDQTGGNALGMFGNNFVLMYLKDGQPLIKVFDTKGRLRHEVKLPNGGSVWGGFVGSQRDPVLFYLFLGLTHPSTIYRLDVRRGRADLWLSPRVNFNREDYVVEQVFYRSKDGTRVPMFIAHKKGFKPDGRSPGYLYGYGGLGWVSFIWYQPHILYWLDRGGVYAQPSIRGGGEYGEDWHRAGMKLKEQNSIDDYLSAAEWLVKQRYTSADRLVANGGSLSGALAGAAIQQRPELFAASIIDRPVLDLLRFDRFTGGAYWSQELGAPANAEEFKVLYSYSPYHNLKRGRCYPATLIMAGELDQTAVPMHAYKFTAAMQDAQGCRNPVLMKVMWAVAHNFGNTAEQQTDSYTDLLTFLVRVLERSNTRQLFVR
jgi:prolyl oligopeptidase